MKKAILLFGLTTLILLSCVQKSNTQDKEVVVNMRKNFVIWTYSGEDEDSLTINQDTLDVTFVTEFKPSIRKISISSKFDLLGTSDTIVKISILGESWNNEGFTTLLASSNSSEITADNQYEFDNTSYTVTIAAYNSVTAAYNSVPAAHDAAAISFDVPFTNPTAGTTDTLEFPVITFTEASYNVVNAEQTMTNATQTATPFDFDYKRITVRYIYPAVGDETGSGLDLDELKIRFWLQ